MNPKKKLEVVPSSVYTTLFQETGSLTQLKDNKHTMDTIRLNMLQKQKLNPTIIRRGISSKLQKID